MNGILVTTNQIDDYINRGDHPLLSPLSLYVYSMWVSRVEKHHSNDKQVTIPFSTSYKLAVGYVQLVMVMERVPKIDGFTMPPPREGKDDEISDFELNAMFKSVLHRPTSNYQPSS